MAQLGIDSRRVDEMEVWEVASALGMWRPAEEGGGESTNAPVGPKPRDPLAGVDLIKLRVEAARRGQAAPQLPSPRGGTSPPTLRRVVDDVQKGA